MMTKGDASVQRMQAIDAAAIEAIGVPRLLLMDHAGLAVARAVRALAQPTAPVIVCAGVGFNGGDGLSAARHLLDEGFLPQVVLAGRIQDLRDEPAIFAKILERLKVRVESCLTAEQVKTLPPWPQGAVLVDALLGIGLRGPVREPAAALIARITQSGLPVVAVDVPSGLDGDTGEPHGVAVKASVTVTFGLAKQGLRRGQGPALSGRVIVERITFPRAVLQDISP